MVFDPLALSHPANGRKSKSFWLYFEGDFCFSEACCDVICFGHLLQHKVFAIIEVSVM